MSCSRRPQKCTANPLLFISSEFKGKGGGVNRERWGGGRRGAKQRREDHFPFPIHYYKEMMLQSLTIAYPGFRGPYSKYEE